LTQFVHDDVPVETAPQWRGTFEPLSSTYNRRQRMDYVRGALLALVVGWTLQMIGSWFQMRRYGDAVRDAVRHWNTGYLGVGACKVRWGRGAIAIVVVSDDLRIRQFSSMSALTVLGRFRQHDGFDGLSADEFNARLAGSTLRRSIAKAAADALERAQKAALSAA
jgi:glucitol operon activator protein